MQHILCDQCGRQLIAADKPYLDFQIRTIADADFHEQYGENLQQMHFCDQRCAYQYMTSLEVFSI